ncbi:MAG: copper chaperone PCu(A)C [Rubrivivax sp.]|nr:copper chaperone PCu(A)C [Rubrivivax sp.]
MFTRRHLIGALLVAAATPFFTALPSHAQSEIQILQPWARPTVAGQAGGGGFLTLRGAASADRLIGGTAPGIAERVELHTMRMEGDVMRMREVPAIDVPAGQTVELKPGGLHVMFMGLKAPLKEGDSFALTLRFEKAGEKTVQVQVSMRPPAGAAAAMPAAGHGGHKH